MKLARRTESIDLPGTSRMRTLANELRASGLHIVDFAAGELDIDTSEHVKEGAHRAIDEARNAYTPTLGLPELRGRIAERITQHTGVRFDASEVGLTAGAKAALFETALVLLDPDDEVLIPLPYWPTFAAQVELAQARPVFVDTRPHGYRLNARMLEPAITPRTRAVIVNSPNNPTGAVYDRAELTGIAALAIERDLWLVLDECYASLVRAGHDVPHILTLEPRLRERCVMVDSFSKRLAITGWRLGWLAAPDAVIRAVENLQAHTASNPNAIAQHAVLHALKHDDGRYAARLARLLEGRMRRAVAGIERVARLRTAPAEGAFYLFVDISACLGRWFGDERITDADRFCELALSKAHVALVSGRAFGDTGSVRLSYAIADDEIDEGVERLRNFVERLA